MQTAGPRSACLLLLAPILARILAPPNLGPFFVCQGVFLLPGPILGRRTHNGGSHRQWAETLCPIGLRGWTQVPQLRGFLREGAAVVRRMFFTQIRLRAPGSSNLPTYKHASWLYKSLLFFELETLAQPKQMAGGAPSHERNSNTPNHLIMILRDGKIPPGASDFQTMIRCIRRGMAVSETTEQSSHPTRLARCAYSRKPKTPKPQSPKPQSPKVLKKRTFCQRG